MENCTKVSNDEVDSILTMIQQINSKFDCTERRGDKETTISQSNLKFERSVTNKRDKSLAEIEGDSFNNSNQILEKEPKEVFIVVVELFVLLFGFVLNLTISKINQFQLLIEATIERLVEKAFPDLSEEITWRTFFKIFKQNLSVRCCLFTFALAVVEVLRTVLFIHSVVINILLYKVNVPKIF